MTTQEASQFFQGFNFDTLLALISCLTGIVALFIGGAAYHNCRHFNKSFNDRKKFKDGSQDHSQKAAGDIINNNGVSDTQLMTLTETFASMNNSNFSRALDKVYTQFQERCDENLRAIIEESQKVIDDNKFQIGGYTKLDWIHIYLESAKNTSDEYMQKVWARVLARELAIPGSFSFKTLDVLKNMSSDDFKLYEKMNSLQVDGSLVQNEVLKDYLSWVDCLRLQQMGLISLASTTRTLDISAKSNYTRLICNESLVLTVVNDKDDVAHVCYDVFVLTSAAEELGYVATQVHYRQYFIDALKKLKKTLSSQCGLQLYDVTYIEKTWFRHNGVDLLQ